jgi:hypothetical protein
VTGLILLDTSATHELRAVVTAELVGGCDVTEHFVGAWPGRAMARKLGPMIDVPVNGKFKVV